MRKSVVEAITLTAALLFGGLALGQTALQETPTPKPTQSKLEEMLEKALKDNPDIRLAAAKLAEAEAELNRARLQVVHQVATAYQAVEAQKAAVESAAAELAALKTGQTGAVPTAKERAAEKSLIDAKAKLAILEADLPYLLGQQAPGVDAKILRLWLLKDAQQPPEAANAEMLRRYYLDVYGRMPTKEELDTGVKPTVHGPTADRIRAALDKPFTLSCKKKSFAYVTHEMNKAFQDASHGLLIKNSGTFDDQVAEDEPGDLSVHFDEMPFGAALQWLEDAAPGNRVVVRDYGLVIAPADQLPPGAPLLHDFWKGVKTEAKAELPAVPPEPIEGQVKGIEKDLVRVSLGSDAGLIKGQILFVYRLPMAKDAEAKYLGKIRTEEVTPTEAVARLESDFQSLPRAGDHVVSQIPDANATEKHRPGKAGDKTPPAVTEPPPKSPTGIEGKISATHPDGTVILNIGSETGLGTGDELTAYQPGKDPGTDVEMGILRVKEVSAKESVAVLISAVMTAPQQGWRVVRIAIGKHKN